MGFGVRQSWLWVFCVYLHCMLNSKPSDLSAYKFFHLQDQNVNIFYKLLGRLNKLLHAKQLVGGILQGTNTPNLPLLSIK